MIRQANVNRAKPARGAGRERLLRSGLKLFAEKGYHGTSLRDIARHAGFALSLIRCHFGSKEGLRTAVDGFVIAELRSFYGALSADTGFGSVPIWGRAATEFTRTDRDVLAYLRSALLDPNGGSQSLFDAIYRIQVNFIAGLKRRHLLRDDADEQWAPFVMMFLLLGPLVIAPYATKSLGASIYDDDLVSRRNRAYRMLLEHGLVKSRA